MNYPHHDDFYFQDPKDPQRQLWLKHVPVISTAHITKEDGAVLERSRGGCHVCGHPLACGVLDVCSEGAQYLITTDAAVWEADAGAFKDLLSHFAALGYRWIILDRDGDKIPGLTTFDW